MRSVDRALSILQVIAQRGELSLTDIAAAVDVHKSTAFRLLGTLEARGMVERVADGGAYRLAYGVVQLAAAATRGYDLSVLSRPVCQQLADQLGETVNIAIHDGLAVISIDQIIGSAAVTTVNWVGQRTPMHATAAGKVFLAHLPESHLDTLELVAYTEHTTTDATALRDQLVAVRDLGYATSVEEHEVGLVAVAAPIRAFAGDVVAALVVSGPTFRLTPEILPDLAAAVAAGATEISHLNGVPKPG
ncbi:MAG: helix-turn-helix domain-containing protein [Streptosporangiales bacterium]|nr:helix-turn-helix domain-containing protein [Streptosporangiales bacterium]